MERKMTGYPSAEKPWLSFYTDEAIHATVPQYTIFEYIWEQNKDRLDKVALNYVDRKITYRTLFENIKKASNAFSSIGVKKGDIVTICAVTLPETIYTFYGLNRIGAVCNMVDPRTNKENIKAYIEEVESKVLVTIDAAYNKVAEAALTSNSVEKHIVISPADSLPQPKKFLYQKLKAPKNLKIDSKTILWNRFIANSVDHTSEAASYTKDSPCVIVHTGGTTGIPKGVVLSNDNVNAAAFQAIMAGFDFKPEHSWLNIMPPFIAYGVGNGLHLPLVTGMEVILIPAFNPSEFATLMNKYHPVHMVGVPSHYDKFIHSPKMKNQDLSYVISPVVGGDAMDIALEKEVNEFFESHNCSYPVCKGYGMSEVAAAVCACSSHECNKIGSVGTPWPQTIMAAFDPETGEELPYNEVGEICITGPNTMLGYYHNEEETANILRKHKDGLIWVHSGDMGFIDEDGFVFIKDRIKRMIVRHDGFKVFPSAIENALAKNASVQQSCVVGKQDAEHLHGKVPVAYIQLKPSATKDQESVRNELITLCEKELAEYAQPVAWRFVSELPLTPIGKIDYRVLEEKEKAIE